MALSGLVLLVLAIEQWRARNFGRFDYSHTVRLVVPGVTLTAVGFQTVLSSFFLGILGLPRR